MSLLLFLGLNQRTQGLGKSWQGLKMMAVKEGECLGWMFLLKRNQRDGVNVLHDDGDG